MSNPNVKISNCCRLCLQPVDEYIEIYSDDKDYSSEDKETEKYIITAIAVCYSIKVTPDDNLPSKICKPCVLTLTSFYNTRCMVLTVNKILQQYRFVEGVKWKTIDVTEGEGSSNSCAPMVLPRIIRANNDYLEDKSLRVLSVDDLNSKLRSSSLRKRTSRMEIDGPSLYVDTFSNHAEVLASPLSPTQ